MRRAIVLLVLGVIIALVGLGYGITSAHVTYQQVKEGSIQHYLSDGKTGYLQMTNSPAYFLVNEQDFMPQIHGVTTFRDDEMISLVYDPSTTTEINVKSNMGTHLTGSAYTVVEITHFDTGGQQAFMTAGYHSNHQSYDKNHWPIAIGILIFGIVLAIIAFFLTLFSRKKKAPAIATEQAPSTAASTQPAKTFTYQQPFSSAPEYPQQSFQPTQYPQLPFQPVQYPQQPFSSAPEYPQQPFQPTQYPSQPGLFTPQQEQFPGPTQYPAYPPPQPAQPTRSQFAPPFRQPPRQE